MIKYYKGKGQTILRKANRVEWHIQDEGQSAEI